MSVFIALFLPHTVFLCNFLSGHRSAAVWADAAVRQTHPRLRGTIGVGHIVNVFGTGNKNFVTRIYQVGVFDLAVHLQKLFQPNFKAFADLVKSVAFFDNVNQRSG